MFWEESKGQGDGRWYGPAGRAPDELRVCAGRGTCHGWAQDCHHLRGCLLCSCELIAEFSPLSRDQGAGLFFGGSVVQVGLGGHTVFTHRLEGPQSQAFASPWAWSPTASFIDEETDD
jgi:hypothetical protein